MKKQLTFNDLLVKHSYYCSDSNYYSRDAEASYETWDDFLGDFADSDMDYNLCFRFDVNKSDETGGYDAEIFFMQQRKGKFVPVFIKEVKESDADSIINWLSPRWVYLRSLWKPFS